MEISWLFLFLCVLHGSCGWTDNKVRRFSDGFLFGAATASYQVEGGWDEDGKGENIWDRYFHEHPETPEDGYNGDVASDSYHQYKRDVEILRELGVDYYRFSISWARVLPTGHSNNVNEKGLQYYDNLIDELLKYNIQPMVTLYHYDLPQKLQDLGGWTNPYIIQWFENYARVLFNRYSKKVKYWITLNQPNVCMESYGDTFMPPGIGSKGIGDYMCLKNMLLSHAKVYRLYEKEYKNKYKGSVGISLSLNWFDPVDNSTENVNAAEYYRQLNIGLYMNPIWSKDGDFPKSVKDNVAKNSKAEGYFESRLPKLSSEEIKLLKGSADFLGMNHYTTFLIQHSTDKGNSYLPDTNVNTSQGPEWKHSASFWLKSVPYGLYKLCLYINKHYDYPIVIITENGWSTGKGLKDTSRVDNLKGYFTALLLAIEDGTRVIGYTAWSLVDNVEWTAGVSQRFGLYEVDYESESKTRTARHSAYFYKHVIETKEVDPQWKPKKNMKMNISNRKVKKVEKQEL